MTERVKAITNVPGWLSDYQYSGIPSSMAGLYKSVPLLYRAINMRCDSLSAVPVKVMKGETEIDWPYPEPLETLIWRAEASLLMTGGAYWEIVRNKANVKKTVKYRNPSGMVVDYKDGVINFQQGSAEWANDLIKNTYEMVYFADYDPTNDIKPGVGAAEAAKVDARLLNALSQFPEKFFEGGAMPVTLLGIETSSSEEISRIETFFKRAITGVKNAFRVVGIRSKTIEAKQLTPNLDTLAMPELSEQARKNISVAFGVPESMLDTTASNFATAQEARLSFYEDTIKPRARFFEGIINTQLLEADKLKLVFDFEAMQLFQEDEDDRANVLQKLTTAGVPLKAAMDIAGYPQEKIDLLGELPEPEAQPESPDVVGDELRRWERKAAKAVKGGKSAAVPFESNVIPSSLSAAIAGQLEMAAEVADVKRVFTGAMEWRGYP